MDAASLSQQVYDQLHEKIRSGELRPGARLVNRTLAAEFGTSTIPVREAISRMASEGLLELTPGAGAYVRVPDLNELGELYDIREALEVLAAVEATRLAGDSLGIELRSVCERFKEIANSIDRAGHASATQFSRWLECEEQFHMKIVAASRNRWLVKMVKDLRVISQVFAAHRGAPKMLTQSLAKAALKQHETFLDILEARDVDKARAWMAQHIRSGRESVLAHIASQR